MTEILTESFCERCGTRYTFEAARPRVRMKGVKVLSRGLKNFVMSDGTSMDDAMSAARSETDRELTAHQLDAFHKTFNFCMSCRQYTCPNCWNEVEARCLSCAPHLGHEIMPAPFPDLAPAPGLAALEPYPANGSNGVHADVADAVAPARVVDGITEVDAAARLGALTDPAVIPDWPVADSVVEPEAIVSAELAVEPAADPGFDAIEAEIAALELTPEAIEADDEPVRIDAGTLAEVAAPAAIIDAVTEEPEPEAVVAEPEAVAVEPEGIAADEEIDGDIAARLAGLAAAAIVVDAVTDDDKEMGDKAAAQTSSLFKRFRAGQSIDAELDAFERTYAEAAASDAPAGEAEVEARPADIAAAAVVARSAAAQPLADEPVVVEAIVAESIVESTAAPTAAEPVESLEPAPEPVAAEPVAVETIAAAAFVESVAAEPVEAPETVDDAQPVVLEALAAATIVQAVTDEPVVIERPAVQPAVEPVPAERIAAEVEAEPVAAALPVEPEPEPAPVVEDVVPQPTWQMIAPDPGADAMPPADPWVSPAAASAAGPNGEPQWPSRSASLGSTPAGGLPFLNRPPTPQGGLEALWAESNREVATTAATSGKAVSAVAPCVSCGLSLSATARFCRRCGTAQVR